jgi:hypothetical protein
MIKPIDFNRKVMMLKRVEKHPENKLINNQPQIMDF